MNRNRFPRHWCESCGVVPPNTGCLRTIPITYARTTLTMCHDCWDDVLACCHSGLQVGSVLEELLDMAYPSPQRYARADPVAYARSVRLH